MPDRGVQCMRDVFWIELRLLQGSTKGTMKENKAVVIRRRLGFENLTEHSVIY